MGNCTWLLLLLSLLDRQLSLLCDWPVIHPAIEYINLWLTSSVCNRLKKYETYSTG